MMLAILMAAAQAPAPSPTAAPPAPEKKVCRTNQQLGTLMRSSRTCRTRAEWRALDEADRAVNGQPGQRGSLSTLRSSN